MSRHRLAGFSLALVVLFSSSAGAQDQASLSLGAGYVAPSDIDSTFWITANYRFRIANRFLLEPEVGYWEKGDDGTDFDVSVEDLNFGVNGIFELGSAGGSGLRPWVGAGLGLHLIEGVADFDEDGDDDAGGTDTELGIHLLSGLDFGLSESFDLYAAARYDFVSDLNQFKLYGGVRYRF